VAARTFKTVKLTATHVPDSTTEVGADGLKFTEELPGMIVVAVELDGVPRTIASFKAAKLLAQLDAAKPARKTSGE
jgi:hypothetical protein